MQRPRYSFLPYLFLALSLLLVVNGCSKKKEKQSAPMVKSQADPYVMKAFFQHLGQQEMLKVVTHFPDMKAVKKYFHDNRDRFVAAGEFQDEKEILLDYRLYEPGTISGLTVVFDPVSKKTTGLGVGLAETYNYAAERLRFKALSVHEKEREPPVTGFKEFYFGYVPFNEQQAVDVILEETVLNGRNIYSVSYTIIPNPNRTTAAKGTEKPS